MRLLASYVLMLCGVCCALAGVLAMVMNSMTVGIAKPSPAFGLLMLVAFGIPGVYTARGGFLSAIAAHRRLRATASPPGQSSQSAPAPESL